MGENQKVNLFGVNGTNKQTTVYGFETLHSRSVLGGWQYARHGIGKSSNTQTIYIHAYTYRVIPGSRNHGF